MPQKWKLESTARWLRVYFGGETIADSRNALLMIEAPYQLVYYFPKSDVRMDLLSLSGHTEHSGYKGDAVSYTLKVDDKIANNAGWNYPATLPERPDLSDYIAFNWDAMDAWYEEDEQVFVHPRNPYHRVDTIASSRHIKVVIDGETVAESHRPTLLFETGLPTRYYLPQEDVRMDLLTATDSHTSCPYKGEASYWTVAINGKQHTDIVWSYRDPIPEIPKIKGLLSFYNEKVTIYVDGVEEQRPRTVWS
ncbi:MAG: DUF427 domain-containing protein [Anaerolineae bacterium]